MPAERVAGSAGDQLRGDHCRVPSVAFLQNLQKVVAGACVQWLKPPVVK